jgi:hypothetical protein
MGKTSAARGERIRPVRTIHLNVPNPSTKHEYAVLDHLRVAHALPEALRTQWPGAWIIAHQQEGRQREEDEGPMPRPRHPARAVQDGEGAHDQDDQAGHVVVELAPLPVRVVARSLAILEGHVGEP